MNLLNVKNTSSGYGDTEILHGVSLNVGEGELVTVIGPNGSGKSTLMKTVVGILRSTTGQIIFRDKDISVIPTEIIVRNGISYVPQANNVFPSLSITENLEMGAFIKSGNPSKRISEVLELFPDLVDRGKDKAKYLSGGQRQMLALARALMLDPSLLLLDEPTAGLAPMMINAVFEKIQLINSSGVAILLIEQNAREALKISNRACVLAAGQNQLEGNGEDLLNDPEVARLYLGGQE